MQIPSFFSLLFFSVALLSCGVELKDSPASVSELGTRSISQLWAENVKPDAAAPTALQATWVQTLTTQQQLAAQLALGTAALPAKHVLALGPSQAINSYQGVTGTKLGGPYDATCTYKTGVTTKQTTLPDSTAGRVLSAGEKVLWMECPSPVLFYSTEKNFLFDYKLTGGDTTLSLGSAQYLKN